jgi:hypothetical protein
VTTLPAAGAALKAGESRPGVGAVQAAAPGSETGLLPVRSNQSRMREAAPLPNSQACDRRP